MPVRGSRRKNNDVAAWLKNPLLNMDSERIPRQANGVTAWVSERTTIIDTFLAWKIPCTLVQGASIKD
jgi:hypothetical protein